MTKPNSTVIVFVVDRSGSMRSIATDMIGGFRTFIDKQKETPGDCKVSLVQFDDELKTVYLDRPIADVGDLELVPRGSTALYDALGSTIVMTGERLAKLPEKQRPSQVLFVVITDGTENASREYTRAAVFDQIKHQRDAYKWDFIFLGANQDSLQAATSLGISGGNAVTFSAGAAGTRAMMRGLSEGVAGYRTSGNSGLEAIYGQAQYEATLQSENQPDVNPPVNLIKPPTGVKPAPVKARNQ